MGLITLVIPGDRLTLHKKLPGGESVRISIGLKSIEPWDMGDGTAEIIIDAPQEYRIFKNGVPANKFRRRSPEGQKKKRKGTFHFVNGKD